jgi:hypothetical protein
MFLRNPRSLKTCPYCDTAFPREETHCPACGASYWEAHRGEEESSEEPPPQTEQGCLSLLLVPVITSLAATALVIAVGFLINTFVFFESQQVKVLWIGGSIAVGLGIFRLITHLKQSLDKKKGEKQS